MTDTQLVEFESRVFKALNQVSGIADPEQWLIDSLTGGSGDFARPVTLRSVMGLPNVWASVQVLGGHIGISELQIRALTPAGSEPLPNHLIAQLMNYTTNTALGTPCTIKETLQMHAMIGGNGRAWIRRNDRGRAVELLPLPPESSFCRMYNGQKYHYSIVDSDYSPELAAALRIYANADVQDSYRQYQIPDRDVFHIPSIVWNSVEGVDVVTVLRNVFGTDQAGQDTVTSHLNNQGRPSIVFEEGRRKFGSKKAADAWLKDWEERHSGPKNAGKPGLLPRGMALHLINQTASDGQYTDLRKISGDDVAKVMGTHPIMGEGAAVYKDQESRIAAYMTNTLSRWYARWEQETRRKLLLPFEQTSVEVVMSAHRIWRSNIIALSTYTASMRQQNAMTGNQARQLHGLNETDDPIANSYANPNTTTPEQTSPEPDDSSEATIENRLRQVQVANLQSLIEGESRRLVEASKKPDFIDWLDRFYDGFSDRASKVFQAQGLTAAAGIGHCHESKRLLIQGVGSVPAGPQRVPVVADITASWQERASDYVQN